MLPPARPLDAHPTAPAVRAARPQPSSQLLSPICSALHGCMGRCSPVEIARTPGSRTGSSLCPAACSTAALLPSLWAQATRPSLSMSLGYCRRRAALSAHDPAPLCNILYRKEHCVWEERDASCDTEPCLQRLHRCSTHRNWTAVSGLTR